MEAQEVRRAHVDLSREADEKIRMMRQMCGFLNDINVQSKDQKVEGLDERRAKNWSSCHTQRRSPHIYTVSHEISPLAVGGQKDTQSPKQSSG